MAECAAHAAGACFGRDGGALRRTRQGACRTGRRWGVSYFHRSRFAVHGQLDACGHRSECRYRSGQRSDFDRSRPYGCEAVRRLDLRHHRLAVQGHVRRSGSHHQGLEVRPRIVHPEGEHRPVRQHRRRHHQEPHVGGRLYRRRLPRRRVGGPRGQHAHRERHPHQLHIQHHARQQRRQPDHQRRRAGRHPRRRDERRRHLQLRGARRQVRRRPPSPRWAAKGCTWARW